MPDKHKDYDKEDDEVEEQDGKDGTEEGSKEHPNLTNETAGRKRKNNILLLVTSKSSKIYSYKSRTLSELSVKVIMKSGSIASGMMTGTMGTTVGGRNNL